METHYIIGIQLQLDNPLYTIFTQNHRYTKVNIFIPILTSQICASCKHTTLVADDCFHHFAYCSTGSEPTRTSKVVDNFFTTQLGGEEIINYLGRSGWFAAGAAVCEMVEAVICNQRRVFTACAYLTGEYGYKDIYLGVPVILGKNGVERIIELELDADDIVRFHNSSLEVGKTLDLLKKSLL